MLPPSDYPDHDFPWTMYFNGEPMPKWANCWHLAPLVLNRAKEMMDEWDETVGYHQFWALQCRMDHVGVIESEDPETFRICCLAFTFLMLRDEVEIRAALVAGGEQYGGKPNEIFDGLRDGLFAMHQRTHEDGIAFWTNGYEADRDFLRDAIRRHHLPKSDPDWFEAPHAKYQRSEAAFRMSSLRREIISLIGSRPLPKELRRQIHGVEKDPHP